MSSMSRPNVVLDKKFGAPTITNDGVTIAKEIELKQQQQMRSRVWCRAHLMIGNEHDAQQGQQALCVPCAAHSR
jgi:hypothetical protein